MALNKRKSTRVAAYGLVVQGEKLLMCRLCSKEKNALAWTLPGGGLDFGESPEAGAIREVMEETGLSIQIGQIAGVGNDFYDGPGYQLHHVQIIYHASVVGGEMRNEVDGSTDMCAWVSLEESRGLRLVPVAELGLRLAFGVGL